MPVLDAGVVSDLHAAEGERLYNFARHLGLADEDAADVVQESLLRLWRELRRGTAVANPAAWTYRTCYRLAMSQHRWRRQLSRLLPRLAPQRAGYSGPESSDRLSVWQAVDRLSPRQRVVIYLHYAADLPFDEVGLALGISASSARTHAGRAMVAIRSQLDHPKEAQ
jgi:RNA polymerase sigma factor (sigma-70 family)